MEHVTYYNVQALCACLEFDDEARTHSESHGNWIEHMIDHVLEVEHKKRQGRSLTPV